MFFIAMIVFGIGMFCAVIGFCAWSIMKIPQGKRKQAFTVMGTAAVLLFGYGIYRYCSIERDGEAGGLWGVRVGDVEYVYEGFDLSEEGKVIGKIDGFEIREVPEDPDHNFLVIRSFTDQSYLVRKDYEIPVSGTVSCCYVSGMRSADGKLLQAIGEILQAEYDDGFQIELDGQHSPEGLHSLSVGYEGCPVGTDRRYKLGCLDDGRWVLVFREDDAINNGRHTVICHEIAKEQAQVLEDSGMFR